MQFWIVGLLVGLAASGLLTIFFYGAVRSELGSCPIRDCSLGPTGIRASAGTFIDLAAQHNISMQFFLWPDTRSELLRSKLSRGSTLILLFHAVCLGFGAPTFPISILGIFGAVIGLATLAPTSDLVASLVAFIVPVALIGASGDFRVGLEHGHFMLHQSEGQQLGVSSEVMLAAREVIRLQSTATKLLSKLLAIPTEWSAMDYEQYCSTSQARITGFLVWASGDFRGGLAVPTVFFIGSLTGGVGTAAPDWSISGFDPLNPAGVGSYHIAYPLDLFEEGSVTSPQGRAVPVAAVLCGEFHQLGLAGAALARDLACGRFPSVWRPDQSLEAARITEMCPPSRSGARPSPECVRRPTSVEIQGISAGSRIYGLRGDGARISAQI
jgi:hypothetical protein